MFALFLAMSASAVTRAEVGTLIDHGVPDRVVAATIRGGEVCFTWVDAEWIASQRYDRAARAARERPCDGPARPVEPTRRERRRIEREKRRHREAEARTQVDEAPEADETARPEPVSPAEQAALQKIFDALGPEVGPCFVAAVGEGGLPPMFALEVEIGGDGRVVEARFDAAGLRDTAAEACVVALVQPVVFDPGAPARVRYGFEFREP